MWAKVLSIVCFALNVEEAILGYGKHIYYVDIANIPSILKRFYIGVVLLVLCGLASRISIALFLIKIFAGISWSRTWFFYLFIAFTSIASVVPMLLVWASCRPVSKLWNTTGPGKCWPKSTAANLLVLQGGKNRSL